MLAPDEFPDTRENLLDSLEIDPTTYIVSANIHRRHLNKGQQAMAVAMAYPETQQGKKRTSEINSEASDRYINYARYVIRNNPIPEGQKYPDRCLAVMGRYPITALSTPTPNGLNP